VQIRSLENHYPLPGIEVGDIGVKLGYNSNDNGYLSFDQVRIPREDMCARFACVEKDGEFKVLGDLRSLYMIMSGTRVGIMNAVFWSMQRATLIATRYAVCRRQFKNQEGSSQERKLLDY
jgi:acyl-CoA oxidase